MADTDSDERRADTATHDAPPDSKAGAMPAKQYLNSVSPCRRPPRPPPSATRAGQQPEAASRSAGNRTGQRHPVRRRDRHSQTAGVCGQFPAGAFRSTAPARKPAACARLLPRAASASSAAPRPSARKAASLRRTRSTSAAAETGDGSWSANILSWAIVVLLRLTLIVGREAKFGNAQKRWSSKASDGRKPQRISADPLRVDGNPGAARCPSRNRPEPLRTCRITRPVHSTVYLFGTSRRFDSRHRIPATPMAVVMGAIVPSSAWPTTAPKVASIPNCIASINARTLAMCGAVPSVSCGASPSAREETQLTESSRVLIERKRKYQWMTTTNIRRHQVPHRQDIRFGSQ